MSGIDLDVAHGAEEDDGLGVHWGATVTIGAVDVEGQEVWRAIALPPPVPAWFRADPAPVVGGGTAEAHPHRRISVVESLGVIPVADLRSVVEVDGDRPRPGWNAGGGVASRCRGRQSDQDEGGNDLPGSGSHGSSFQRENDRSTRPEGASQASFPGGR